MYFPRYKSIIITILILSLSSGVLASDLADRLVEANVSIHSNGTIKYNNPQNADRHSPNGRYWATYEIGNVSHDSRELHNFSLYDGNIHRFSLDMAPGSEMYISNSGHTAFINMLLQHQNQVMVLFYSPRGEQILSTIVKTSTLFGFSDAGNHFAMT